MFHSRVLLAYTMYSVSTFAAHLHADRVQHDARSSVAVGAEALISETCFSVPLGILLKHCLCSADASGGPERPSASFGENGYDSRIKERRRRVVGGVSAGKCVVITGFELMRWGGGVGGQDVRTARARAGWAPPGDAVPRWMTSRLSKLRRRSLGGSCGVTRAYMFRWQGPAPCP